MTKQIQQLVKLDYGHMRPPFTPEHYSVNGRVYISVDDLIKVLEKRARKADGSYRNVLKLMETYLRDIREEHR